MWSLHFLQGFRRYPLILTHPRALQDQTRQILGCLQSPHTHTLPRFLRCPLRYHRRTFLDLVDKFVEFYIN